MTDSAAASAPAPKTKTVKKKTSTKPKAPANHPTYNDMVVRAVKAMKERKGSSRQGLLKYIIANFNVGADAKAVNVHLKMALKRGVTSKVLKQMNGTGALGRFKAGEEIKVKKPFNKTLPEETINKSPLKKAAPKTKKPSAKKMAAPTKLKSPTKKSKPAPVAAKKAAAPKKAENPVANKVQKTLPKITTSYCYHYNKLFRR